MRSNLRIGVAFRREVSDGRRWLTRALVIGGAVAAGLTVVAFTLLTEKALSLFFTIRQWLWWSPLVLTPLLTAGVVWLTRRHVPGAAGSGIPQIMAALEGELTDSQRQHLVSLKLSIAKVALTSAGLLGGLSLGREGPCVQIAAGVMQAMGRWLPKGAKIGAHGLLVAGGAAGIAAAFNTPLAGVMFAIEELSRSPEQRNSGVILAAIVLAGLISVSVFGNATYFGVLHVPSFGWSLLVPAMILAVVCGLGGGLFARLLIASLNPKSASKLVKWRQMNPVLFAAACGLAVAVIGLVSDGASFGSGYAHTRAMLEGQVTALTLDAIPRFVATWLTTWSGVPAGIFAPSLSIGASLGNDVAALTDPEHATTLIALGMAGFLAAATQAPLTAFIIVMEMVDGHAMVLSLMACAFFSSGLSRLLTKPLYSTLASFQLEIVRNMPNGEAEGDKIQKGGGALPSSGNTAP